MSNDMPERITVKRGWSDVGDGVWEEHNPKFPLDEEDGETVYRRENTPSEDYAARVRVKPLEWDASGCVGRGVGLIYRMGERTPGLFELYQPFHTEEEKTQAEVQAIAQADYERRIRSALLPADQPKGAS